MVIILGDVHLGAAQNLGKITTGLNINSRVADQLKLLDWTLDQALIEHSHNIIITGDVFEEPKPAPNLVVLFLNWLKKCQVENVNVHIIIGNHDILRSGNIYSSPLDIITEAELSNVFVYRDMDTINIDYTSFTLMPFRDRKSLQTDSNAEAIKILSNRLIYELESIPKTYNKVVVGHFAIEGSIYVGGEIDDISNELFCPLDMFNGYDYVWMGHVHSAQVLRKTSPHIAHVGSMDVSNFGESGHKKHIVIFDSNANEFKTRELPVRDLKKISITVPENTEDATSYVIAELQKSKLDKSIIKLEINVTDQNSKAINKSNIEQNLKKLGAFSIASISETKKMAQVIKKDSSVSIDTDLDIMQAIKKYADKHIDKKMKSKYLETANSIIAKFKMGDK